ncbi:MAG: hypothetical protein COB53_06990 [Elusimicrobia bacterium]|nr:MAG: hypothetical protein COB53_06990 [Elusimicrobiota bacterium]
MLSPAEAERFLFACVAAVAVGAIAGLVLVWIKFRMYRRAFEGPLPSQNSSDKREPSLYDLIRKQHESRPKAPLELDRFPSIKAPGGEGLTYAPGLRDVMSRRVPKEADWKRVRRIVRQVCLGELTHWKSVEGELAGLPAAASADALLEHTTWEEATEPVRRVFLDVARRSNDYEAVKWGIVVGGLRATRRQLDDLFLLAHHPEFTPYCVWLIQNACEDAPQLKRSLVNLLAESTQWGVVTLIDQLIEDEELMLDPDVQRKALIYGMENCDGLAMEVAFTLAGAIDLRRFFGEARGDDRVYRRVVDLVTTLANEPQPLGGLDDLPNGEKVYSDFMTLLEKREPEINALYALDSLRVFLEEQAGDWESRDVLLSDINSRWEKAFSIQRVREGFDDADRGWFSFELTKRYRLKELLGEVRSRFSKAPSLVSISTLAAFGGRENLELLLHSIGRVVDFEWRARHVIGDPSPWGPQHEKSAEYAEIVHSLGRLGTEDAIEEIKTALCDYEGTVRTAALHATAELPRSKQDAALVDLVRERLSDPYDAAALEAAITARGLPISLSLKEFEVIVACRKDPAPEFITALRALQS